MKQVLIFSIFICLIVLFWACGDDSNPVNTTARNFDPFALWDTASSGIASAVQSLAVKDTNLFAGTTASGVYRTANNGENWIQVNTGLAGGGLDVHALLVKDSIVYAGTNSGIYISTNNGSNWTASNSGMGAIVVRSLIRKDTNIFAGTTSGVYISSDDGATWSSSGLNSYVIVTLCVKGKRLFAGTSNTSNGLYRSIDNGANWLRIVEGMTGLAVNSLAAKDTNLFAGTSNGVFRSSNDSTWTGVNDGLYPAYAMGVSQSFFVYGSSILAGFDGYAGVYLTLNNGASWISCSAGLDGFSANVFAYNGNYLFVGGQSQGGGGRNVWRHPL